MYEGDFVKEGIVSFDIDGRKFKYNLTTAGMENDWLPQYMYIGKNKKPVHDLGVLNKLKMLRLVEVPYSPKEIIGIDKEWKDLNDDQKWKLLGKLKSDMFTKIAEAISNADNGDDTVKKNL